MNLSHVQQENEHEQDKPDIVNNKKGFIEAGATSEDKVTEEISEHLCGDIKAETTESQRLERWQHFTG